MELVRQRVEREGAGLKVSVEFPLSEGLRARSGLKGGEFSVILYYIQNNCMRENSYTVLHY